MNSDLQKCYPGGVSRRAFLRTLGTASAAAAAFPAVVSYGQAQQSSVISAPSPDGGRRSISKTGAAGMRQLPPDTVIISSNENPLGPASVALSAICTTAAQGGRYHEEEYEQTVKVFTDQFGLKPGYVALFPGSGGPLDLALMSNLGPDKPLVYGDPSYEQGPRAAEAMHAPKFPVRLTPTYAHDVKAMLAAHPSPGVYYIVNPNNPTGTITPREDIVWLLKNKPKGSIVIVDEAYFHFSDQDSVIPLVADDQDLIVTRTFSKIYGMAGLRAGFAIARPDLLDRFVSVAPPARSVGSISITSAAAARASLLDPNLVPTRRKINADNRSASLEFLTKHGYKIVPGSQANFFMVDVGRPGRGFQQDMLKENVAIGRTWSAMPTYVRVTVGTKPEMDKFQAAFVKCMDMKPGSSPSMASVSSLNSISSPHLYRVPSELFRG